MAYLPDHADDGCEEHGVESVVISVEYLAAINQVSHIQGDACGRGKA